MISTLQVLALGLLAPSSAHAGDTLLALASGDTHAEQAVFEIDAETGAGTLITGTGRTDLRGLAIDPDTGLVYTSFQRRSGTTGIGTLDLDTGVVTPIGGTRTFVALTVTPDGTLYGIQTASSTSHTFEIDKHTGAATQVTFDTTRLYGPGLASNSEGTLFTSSWQGNLFEVDLGTGTSAAVGHLSADGYANQAMVFGEDDTLYVTSHPCNCGFTPTGLWAVDPDTMAGTFVGFTGLTVRGLATVRAADCVTAMSSARLADRAFTRSAVWSHGTTELGGDASSGSIVSDGEVVLRSRAWVAGDVQTTAGVTMQEEAGVAGDVSEGLLDVSLPHAPQVSEPSYGTEDITVSTEEVLRLRPGSYGRVTVNGGGRLVLTRAGVYAFRHLTVNQRAVLRHRPGTEVMVDEGMIWRGRQRGETPLPVTQTGEGTSHFERSFWGSVVAPHSAVRLAGQGSAIYTGASFVAGDLVLEADAQLVCE